MPPTILWRQRVHDLRAPLTLHERRRVDDALEDPVGMRRQLAVAFAKVIGACTIVAPAARAALTSARVLSSIPVCSMTSTGRPTPV